MADSFNEFKRGLQDFRSLAERQATRRLRRVSLKALELIVVGTPVLTGCCRGNWIVSMGTPSRIYDAKKKDANGGATISVGASVIESATLGVDVIIENSCPYAIRLENGWSRQKPPGSMIREPLAKLKQAIEKGAM